METNSATGFKQVLTISSLLYDFSGYTCRQSMQWKDSFQLNLMHITLDSLLLEIITGRKNGVYCPDSPFSNLVGHVM